MSLSEGRPTFLREWSPSISKFETKGVGRRGSKSGVDFHADPSGSFGCEGSRGDPW
jgi:hypothetical protein